MITRLRGAGVVAGCVLLAGCAQQSRPVSIGQALQTLQQQLQAAGAVSAVGSDPAHFALAIRAAQCGAQQADPEIPLLAHDLTVDLTGSFSASGGFTIGSAAVGTSLTGSVARGQTQEIGLPLTFVALSELPASVAAQRLAPLTLLPARDRGIETAQVLADRNELSARIRGLIVSWTPAACTGAGQAGPFQPNHRPAT